MWCFKAKYGKYHLLTHKISPNMFILGDISIEGLLYPNMYMLTHDRLK